MEKDRLYREWKSYRADISPPDDFSSKVMEQVHEYERDKNLGLIAGLLSQIYFLPNRAMRLAFALALSLLGLYRLFHVVVNILVPNALIP